MLSSFETLYLKICINQRTLSLTISNNKYTLLLLGIREYLQVRLLSNRKNCTNYVYLIFLYIADYCFQNTWFSGELGRETQEEFEEEGERGSSLMQTPVG